MTRKESRKVKLRKQYATMRERGYKQVCGRWVRENSDLHMFMVKQSKLKVKNAKAKK